MKGIKFILFGIAVILVGIGFSCSDKYSLFGFGEIVLFIAGIGLAYYGLKKE